MEGVASEAASLAGHLGLDNLCWVYDNNHITIEGNTSLAFTEDVAARFLGYGWNVLRVGDANDLDRIEHALGVFRQTKGRPTLIILDSHIGYGSPAQAGHRRRPRRAARRRGGPPRPSAATAGPRRRSSSSPTASASTSPPASARAAPRRDAGGPTLFAAYRDKLPGPRDRDRSDAAARAAGRVGSQPARLPGRRRRASPAAMPRARCSTCSRRTSRGSSAARPTSGPSNKTTLTYEGAGSFQAGNPGRQEPALRHPRARDGGDRQRPLAVEAAGVRRDLLHLQRLRAAGHPALGADGAADASSSSRTTPWATARTAPPTSRWSTWPRCAPSPGWSRCGPATPTRSWRRTAT